DTLDANGLLGFRGGAERARSPYDPVKLRLRVRDYRHATERRVRFVLAALELLDREVAAEVHDHVHDLGQDHRVDDMAGQHQARPVAALPVLSHASARAAPWISAFSAAAARPGLSA